MPRKSATIKQNTGAAVIYARYSSHNQKDASIEQQVEACMKHAKSLGLSVIETYEDRAVSGKTDKRVHFQRMMKDAAHGKFNYVLSWKSNRIGRNMLNAMMNEQILNDYGVRVLYAEEDFDDTAAGRFALRSMMNVNQFYSENMAEDIRRGMMDNAKQCKANGLVPFGYTTSKDKHYLIDEPKAQIVRDIYEKVAAGHQLIDIVRNLNARGIKTRIGKEWNRSSFNKLLHNERYRGIYIFKDLRIEGGIPRIISDELFFRVQEVLQMKTNPRGSAQRRINSTYLLTGKLFCGHCKSPMTGASGTGKSGNLFAYYRCQKRKTEHTCDKKNVQRDWIEKVLARYILEYCLRDDIIELIADKTVEYNKRKEKESQAGILEGALSDVKKGIANMLKAIEAGIITDTTKARLMELETQKADLQMRIADEKANLIQVNRDDIISSLAVLKNGDVESKRFQAQLFNLFLRAAYLYDRKLTMVFNFIGEKNKIDVPIEDLVDDDTLELIAEEAEGFAQPKPSSTKLYSSTFTMSGVVKNNTEMLVKQASPYFL